MNLKNKLTYIFLAVAAGVNILRFLLYYISTYITESAAMIYISSYFSEITYMLFPLITAAFIHSTYKKHSFGKAMLLAIPFSLAEILYLFPYRAFELAYDGYEITVTLLFAILIALITVILNYAKALFILFIIIFLPRIFAKQKGKTKFHVKGELSDGGAFDFSNPEAKGIFGASLTVFIFAVISEIIDTVGFLLNYSGTYRASEILYILFRYIFILAMLIISHATAYYAKKQTEKY